MWLLVMMRVERIIIYNMKRITERSNSALLVVRRLDENFLHVNLLVGLAGFEDSVAGSTENGDRLTHFIAQLFVEIHFVFRRQINYFELQIVLAVFFGLVHEETSDSLASERLPHNNRLNETRKWQGWNWRELEMS